MDASSGLASAPTARARRRLFDVVGDASVVPVEDEPAPSPGAYAAAHLDEEAGGAVRLDADVSGAADDEVSGLFDELQQVERLTAHRQIPRQRTRLQHIRL